MPQTIEGYNQARISHGAACTEPPTRRRALRAAHRYANRIVRREASRTIREEVREC
jgi:hypothetical protein